MEKPLLAFNLTFYFFLALFITFKNFVSIYGEENNALEMYRSLYISQGVFSYVILEKIIILIMLKRNSFRMTRGNGRLTTVKSHTISDSVPHILSYLYNTCFALSNQIYVYGNPLEFILRMIRSM